MRGKYSTVIIRNYYQNVKRKRVIHMLCKETLDSVIYSALQLVINKGISTLWTSRALFSDHDLSLLNILNNLLQQLYGILCWDPTISSGQRLFFKRKNVKKEILFLPVFCRACLPVFTLAKLLTLFFLSSDILLRNHYKWKNECKTIQAL